MFSFKKFCDLNVCVYNIEKLEQICNTYIELGYQVIAVNQIMSEKEKVPKRKANKQSSSLVPKCVCLKKLQNMFEGKLKILNRLTFSFDSCSDALDILKDENTHEYDLLAGIPNNLEAVKYACATLDVDILTYDSERGNHLEYSWNRKMYNMAVKRGVFFEIMYVPALFSSTLRQSVISRAHMYYTTGKLKNAIISSGSTLPLQVKEPYDIINFALILGFSEESAKFAITENVKKLLKRAALKRLHQIGPVLVECNQFPSSESKNSDPEETVSVECPQFPSNESRDSEPEETESGGIRKKLRLEPTV